MGPVPKLAIRGWTLHQVSVVVVVIIVSIRDESTITLSTKFRQHSLKLHGEETDGIGSKAALDEYPPRLMIDND